MRDPIRAGRRSRGEPLRFTHPCGYADREPIAGRHRLAGVDPTGYPFALAIAFGHADARRLHVAGADPHADNPRADRGADGTADSGADTYSDSHSRADSYASAHADAEPKP